MKQHLSEPRPGAESVMEKRAHADRCKELPKDLPDDVDLMIEAKDKVGGSDWKGNIADES
jgi:UV DNA damage endonuclease